MSAAFEIRPVVAGDETEWRRLWTDYLTFYESTATEEIYATTWSRLMGNVPHDPKGFLAVKAGKPVGLVHYFFHRHCWRIEDVCYLQDLYADPAVRGSGVGRALIESVYAAADEAGSPYVYWSTQDFNETARHLYDRIGEATPFIKYQRKSST